jgi:hypothetical protein
VSEVLFDVAMPEVRTPAPEPTVIKWTERMMLDLIHARYTKAKGGNGPRYVVAEHVRNEGGFGSWNAEHFRRTGRRSTLRTVDALAIDLWPSTGHLIHGFEVKVSRSDWLTELKDPEKAEAFKPYCDHWWLVVPDASIVRDDLPEGWGMLAVGNGGLRIRKRAPKLDRQPMPLGMTAAWLRAVSKVSA